MDREWFILVRGEKKGPFSLLELKQKYTITPDTFVWKKGFSSWKKAGKVKEFEKFFNVVIFFFSKITRHFKNRIKTFRTNGANSSFKI